MTTTPAARRREMVRISAPSMARRAGLGGGVLLGHVVFVFVQAWPSFAHNGLGWFGAGGNVDDQIQAIFTPGRPKPAPYVYTFRAWPLIWSTLLTAGALVVLSRSRPCSSRSSWSSSRPTGWADPRAGGALPRQRALGHLRPARRPGAGPLHRQPPDHGGRKARSRTSIQLSGYELLAAVIVLTVMIAPIMIAIFADALRSVPPAGSRARWRSGVNRWRTSGSRRARGPTGDRRRRGPRHRPGARRVGDARDALRLVAFAPNPLDGLIFIFEPPRRWLDDRRSTPTSSPRRR